MPRPEDYKDFQSASRWSAACRKVSESMGAAFGLAGSVTLLLIVLLVFAADVASCFGMAGRDRSAGEEVLIRELNPENQIDRRLAARFLAVWSALGGGTESLTLLVVESPEVNAASFGLGGFALWLGLDELADAQLEALIAHEIAHDRLSHSRKVAELSDVTSFVGDLLGVASRADRSTAEILKNWAGAAAVPRYSRQQELEADSEAARLLVALGYEEGAALFCTLLDRLIASSGAEGGGFLDSHPAIRDRKEALRQSFPSEATQLACR